MSACTYDRSVLPRWHQDDRGWRNRSRGVHLLAAPGAYARVRPWSGRQHWLTFVVPVAVALHREVLKREELSAVTFGLWARVESGYVQDQRTGRRCIVRPATVATVMGCTPNTVRKCRRVARRLGLQVVVAWGRMLTCEESWAARRRGSTQRGLSTECALTIPAPVTTALSASCSVSPTSGRARPSHPRRHSPPLAGARAEKLEAAPPPPGQKGRPPDPSPAGSPDNSPGNSPGNSPSWTPQHPHHASHADQAARPDRVGQPPRPGRDEVARRRRAAAQLARDTTRALPWLTTERPGRLRPALTRFATATPAWTGQDIADAIATLRTQRGLTTALTADAIATRPAVVLAAFLRQVHERHDHPRLAHATLHELRCHRPECDHGYITIKDPTNPIHGHWDIHRCTECRPGAWPHHPYNDLDTLEDPDQADTDDDGYGPDDEPPF